MSGRSGVRPRRRDRERLATLVPVPDAQAECVMIIDRRAHIGSDDTLTGSRATSAPLDRGRAEAAGVLRVVPFGGVPRELCHCQWEGQPEGFELIHCRHVWREKPHMLERFDDTQLACNAHP